MGFRWRRDKNQDDAVVLGTQMAAAIAAEALHQAVERAPSPLAGLRYDAAGGDFDLFRYIESPTDARVADVLGQLPSDNSRLKGVRDSLSQDELYLLEPVG